MNFGDYLYSHTILNTSFVYQLIAWLIIITINKILLLFIFIIPLEDQLQLFGEWILKPISYNDNLELVIIMIITPICLNIIQYWIQDNFLKGKSQVMNNNNNSNNRNFNHDNFPEIFSSSLYNYQKKYEYNYDELYENNENTTNSYMNL